MNTVSINQLSLLDYVEGLGEHLLVTYTLPMWVYALLQFSPIFSVSISLAGGLRGIGILSRNN
jgi:hypothetical protein